MASEHPGETSVSLTLPESLSEWLDDVADEEDLSREDVLLQLLTAYRQVEGEGAPDGEGALDDGRLTVQPTGPADELVAELRADIESMVETELEGREAEGVQAQALQEQVDAAVDRQLDDIVAAVMDDDRFETALREAVEDAVADEAVEQAELDARVDTVESQFMDLLEDVRERVVQVKREADAKAAASHDHPDLEKEVAALSGDVDALEAEVDEVADRMDAGFDNFEQVLEYLTDSVDELSARQTTLARAVVETREKLQAMAATEAARAAADDLKRTANQHGVETAVCGDCEASVRVSQLSRAQCPHCSATFGGLEPASGFFGSNRLETGSRPALEAGEVNETGFEHGVEEIIESESPMPDADAEERE